MKKKILLCLGATTIAAMNVCAFAACNNETETLPDFDYDYSTPVENFGDGISIDGKPNESVWEGQRMLEADIRNTTVKYTATAYFGAAGVYFAFWVQDDAVYYNAEREIWANSGVEFCVGSPEDTSITYEIDLNAGGKRMLRKYTGAPYTNWFSDLHSAVWTDGEVNTAECKGYTAEIYLPYELFHADGSNAPVNELLVNFAIIRANSSNSGDTNRLWYSIGEQERGLGWAPASQNWYRFDQNGLISNDVTFTVGEHGALEGRSWAIDGDNYEFSVIPEEGYCVDTLLVNGKDVSENLYYTNGIAHYSLKAEGNISVSATFAPLPAAKYTLSGSVASEDEGSTENVRLYAVTRGAVIDVPVENGTYSAQLPEGEYSLYCEASGYMTAIYDVALYGDSKQDVVLQTMFLGSNTVIGSGSNDASWDLSTLGQGTALSLDAGWLVTANHTTMYGTRAFVSANIVLPMSPGAGRRAGFRFVDAQQNGIYVCLYANNEGGSDQYEIQFIELGKGASTIWRYNYVFTDPTIRELAESTGVPFAALYDGGKVTIWVNGQEIRKDWSLPGNGITSIGEDSKVVPGLTTCGYGDYYHVQFNTTGYDQGYPVNITTEGKGTVVSDKDIYQANDKLTFTVTPKEGYEVTAITVNGKDCFSSLANGKLVLDTGTMTSVNVFVTFTRIDGEEGILSGVIMSGDKPIAGAQVVIFNAAGSRYETTTDETGAFAFDQAIVGSWRISVKVSGYLDYEATVAVDGATTHNITLTEVSMEDKYIVSGGEDYNVDLIEEGIVTYEGVAGEAHAKLTVTANGNEDFWFESVLRCQDTFIMNDAGGLRYGYSIFFGDMAVHFTIGRWTQDAANTYRFMMNNWGNIDKTVPFSDAMNKAYESEAGLRIAAARINGTLYLFAEENGVMKQVMSIRTAETENATVNLGFGTWFQARGAEYKDVSWTIGDIPLAISKSAEGGSVSVSGESLGDTVVVSLTPEQGYDLLTLEVNGKLYTDECVKDSETGNYTLTLENYTDTASLDIKAVFHQSVDFAVELALQLHRYGVGENNLAVIPDGTSVTLSNVNETYTAQAASGTVSFDNVKEGTYQLKVEGYRAITVEVSGNIDQDITLEYDVIGSGNSIDTSAINDGKVTFDLNKSDESILFNEKVAADEDFYITAYFTKVDFDANSLRFGFFAGRDVNRDGQINVYANGESTEAATLNLVYQYYNENREYVLQYPATWGGYFLNEQIAQAMAGEEGVRIGLARVNGVFYYLMEVDGTMQIVFTLNGNQANISASELFIGLIMSKSQAETDPAVLKDVRIEVVKTGTAFSDETIAALFS